MTKRIIFILFTLILLFTSCSLGEDDGSDLVGVWLERCFGPCPSYTFNNNYTGHLRKSSFAISKNISQSEFSFIWNIEKSGINNKVVINYDNGDYDEKVYFFNHDKTKLYVKQDDGTWLYAYDRN